MDKEFDCRKISSIKIKYENGKCKVFEIDGEEMGHRTTRAELKFNGTTLTLYIERTLTDCEIEVLADEEKPIYGVTKFLKPLPLDKN